jgi:hypothetical protein
MGSILNGLENGFIGSKFVNGEYAAERDRREI